MSLVNCHRIVGNLGADPELRETKAGISVCNIRVATHEHFTSKGEKKEDTQWHRVVVYGVTAESVAKYCVKGDEVSVEGPSKTRKWEDSNGVVRYTTEIHADEVKFHTKRKDTPVTTGPPGDGPPMDDVPF